MSKNIIGELKVNDKIIDGDSKLKCGYYVRDEEDMAFNYVGVELSEGFTGITLEIWEDGTISLNNYESGNLAQGIGFDTSCLVLDKNGSRVYYDNYGASKLNFASLTFSFDQLDPTLKQIIENSISSGERVACSQAQWDEIRKHLDNCLYINYENRTMIKITTFYGVEYCFGSIFPNIGVGFSMSFVYSLDNNTLQVFIEEV